MSTAKQNREADLEARVRRLESLISQIASRPVARQADAVRIRISKTAHGFAVGQWVRPEWVLALAKPLDLVTYATGNLPIIAGVVSRVFSVDAFELTIDGYVEGINNPEDTVDQEFLTGLTYSLSEVDAGQVTKNATTTRIECFLATGPHAGIVLQQTKCQAQLFVGPGGFTAGQVLDGLGNLADAADNPPRSTLGVVINDYSSADASVVCRGGVVVFPADVTLPGGTLWLDPTTPGGLTDTKPTTPADQRPILVMKNLGGSVYWVFPPDDSPLGVGDLWDVDLSTPPSDGDTVVWDDTAKRWVPGPGGLDGDADGPSVIARIETGVGPVVAFQATTDKGVLTVDTGELVWQLVKPENMEHRAAYGVLANATASAAAMTELTAADGTLFGRVGSTMGFGSDPELGTTAAGGGYLKIHFAAGKYFEFDTDGTFRIYHSATLSLEVNASGKVTLTYASSNTVTIDPADIVGTSRAFKIREIDVCDSSGVAKKMQLLCTAMY